MALRFPHLNARVFTVFLIVGLPIFAVGAFLAIGAGQAQLRQSFGEQLGQVAEHTAAALDAYIYRRIIDATVVARVPDVRAAAAAGNEVVFDRVPSGPLRADWMNQPVKGKPVPRPHAEAATAFFVDVSRADPLFRDIVATDVHGRVVASAVPRATYYLGGETWWKEAYGDGTRGNVSVADLRWDGRTGVYVMGIAAPISVAGGDQLAGILHITIDAREILALVANVQLGVTGNTYLLREDGSVIYSRWPSPKGSFFAADLVREKLSVITPGNQPLRLSVTAKAADGSRQMVGVARSQLGLSYPHLSWLIAVSQPESSLFGPVTSTGWNLLLVLALTAAGVLAFALWDSSRLAARPELMEMEANLQLVRHPKVHWIAEEEEDEQENQDQKEKSPVVADV